MKLMVIFNHQYEHNLNSFSVMEDTDFVKFQEGWLRYFKAYGEIYLEVYPYELAHFYSQKDFENAFTCYEISEYEEAIFKRVFPYLENCFPEFAPAVFDTPDSQEEIIIDDDEIEF